MKELFEAAGVYPSKKVHELNRKEMNRVYKIAVNSDEWECYYDR